MKEYHNTDPTFDEYKYAYGEPNQSKVKNYHYIWNAEKGFFVLKYSRGNATYAGYLKISNICNSFTLVFQVINLCFIQVKFWFWLFTL